MLAVVAIHSHGNCLAQDGLGLAFVTKEPSEAVAYSRTVVASAAARAVTSFPVVIAAERVGGRRALPLSARRTPVAGIAMASKRLFSIPSTVVSGTGHGGDGGVACGHAKLHSNTSFGIVRIVIGMLLEGQA